MSGDETVYMDILIVHEEIIAPPEIEPVPEHIVMVPVLSDEDEEMEEDPSEEETDSEIKSGGGLPPGILARCGIGYTVVFRTRLKLHLLML